MASGPPQDVIRAAGAVVWRPVPSGPQVVLVHRPRYDDWSFPKGKSNRGEHPLHTAMREVAEETGLRVVLGRCLTASEYEVEGRPKRVRYWAARCTESLGFVPGREVDEISWLDLPQAAARLSYRRDRVLLDEFAAATPDTIPFILLRHTQAGTKVHGLEADLARPLDEQGAADAELLAKLLSSYGSCRVMTSAAERCVASVRPYAHAAGVPVEIEPAFTAAADDQADADNDYRPAARRTAELVAQRRPTLICAHRENLPVMLGAARTALGAGVGLQPDPTLSKGSFVVLQCAGGALVTSEHQDLADLADAAAGQRMSEPCGRSQLTRSADRREQRMADDVSAEVWDELTDIAERLTAPGDSECLRCFLLRMITEFGCDGTYRWTIRWRDMRAAQPGGLLRQFQLRGGCCDCEILLNVFPGYPPSAVPLPCAGVTRPGSAKPCDLRTLRHTA